MYLVQKRTVQFKDLNKTLKEVIQNKVPIQAHHLLAIKVFSYIRLYAYLKAFCDIYYAFILNGSIYILCWRLFILAEL